MRHKIVLTVLLCLATATLAIWAAPALAADGCTCHTAEPPTATAAHAPFVAGVAELRRPAPHGRGGAAPGGASSHAVRRFKPFTSIDPGREADLRSLAAA